VKDFYFWVDLAAVTFLLAFSVTFAVACVGAIVCIVAGAILL